MLKCLQIFRSQVEREIRSRDRTLRSIPLGTKRTPTCKCDGTLTQVGSRKVGQDAERLTQTHMTSEQYVSALCELLSFHHFLCYVKQAVTSL